MSLAMLPSPRKRMRDGNGDKEARLICTAPVASVTRKTPSGTKIPEWKAKSTSYWKTTPTEYADELPWIRFEDIPPLRRDEPKKTLRPGCYLFSSEKLKWPTDRITDPERFIDALWQEVYDWLKAKDYSFADVTKELESCNIENLDTHGKRQVEIQWNDALPSIEDLILTVDNIKLRTERRGDADVPLYATMTFRGPIMDGDELAASFNNRPSFPGLVLDIWQEFKTIQVSHTGGESLVTPRQAYKAVILRDRDSPYTLPRSMLIEQGRLTKYIFADDE